MTASDNLPPSYINWSNSQLVSWIEGLGEFVQCYLPSLRTSSLTGRRLSCLTESDLKSLGITKIGDLRRLQAAISGLIEDFNGLEVENMQSLLFNVIRITDQFSALLKCIRNQSSLFESTIEFEHLLVKCLLHMGLMVKKAASWLERGPFSHFSQLSSLRGLMLQHTIDLNTVLQSALRKSSLLTYQNAMLELTSELKDRLEVVIHDCDDSILLTPCSVEYVSLRKDEQAAYGFTFYTNEFNVHIIKSLDSNLQAPAFTCGAISKDDEIVEVNYQLVLGWEHNAVVRLIQQNTRRLDLRIRKRPSQCSDYSMTSQRHRMHALTKSLRPFTAEPQHSRRSDFIRNRTPKRRTQPLPSVSPNTSATSTGTTTANISHEEKEEEALIAEVPELYEKPSRQSLHQSESLKSPANLSRTHSRPRHERYCQALQPSHLILSSSNEERTPNTESSFSSLSLMEPKSEASISHRKTRRRPVTLGSLDEFAKTSNTVSASSTPPPNLGLSKLQTNSQGWLWLKKRTSKSFGNRYVKRWCVFKQNALYYYRNQEEENAEGLILLHGFTISPVSNESGRSGKYPFRVYNEWTRFVFAADSERARTRWMNMLGLAAIGQSACLWTSPIGGFHPGYLPSSTKVEEKEVANVSSPRLLEPPRPSTSSGENLLRRQPVTIHRCSSSLNVPSSSGLHHPPIDAASVSNRQIDQHSGHNHHHYLSVSATCLTANDSAAESSDEESEIASRKQHLASVVIQTKSEEGQETNEEQNADQSPCRLTRRAAVIRRRRIRRLTEGSISPSVFLTSPPMVIRGQNHPVPSEWMYLSSETVVVEGEKSLEQRQCRRNLTLHSTGTSSCGDEGDSGESLQLLVQNPNRLSPSFSLSSRSSESPEQNSV